MNLPGVIMDPAKDLYPIDPMIPWMSKPLRSRPESISGKDMGSLAETLLQKVIRLVEKGRDKFNELKDQSSMDSVRLTVGDIVQLVDSLISGLEELKKEDLGTPIKIENEAKEMEMLDHLIKEEDVLDPNDLKSVLLEVMKVNRNIQTVVSLISAEYRNPALQSVMSNVSNCLVNYKNRVEELYDDLVNRDYW